jgi:hypothetical protein
MDYLNRNSNMRNKKYLIILILLLIILIGFIVYLLFFRGPAKGKDNIDCKSYSYSDCPHTCVICPPCEACSSISCQTEEYCEAIGFNRSWAEGVNII